MRAVMNTCEKISVMNFGKKIVEGSPEEVSKNKDVIEAYLLTIRIKRSASFQS